jgi:uncharacterized membrane protein
MTMDAYLLLRLIHILSAAVLFGTGLGIAFFMWTAHRSRDVAAIAVTMRNAVIADFMFTAVAVVVQPVTGWLLIRTVGHDPLAPWLVASYVLYVVTGLCWLPVVWMQLRLRDMARTAAEVQAELPPAYFALMRLWFLLGWPAFLSVLAIYALMVLRPAS